MLFNSYQFILGFLPITLLGFWLLGRRGNRAALGFWLVACSLVFYAWWKPIYVLLIGASIATNFLMGRALGSSYVPSIRKPLLFIGIAFNLSLIGYFKYTNFFIATANTLLGENWSILNITLPLAISFFTFQQIAYLIDVYKSGRNEKNFTQYACFVLFFPQLIAGPIVRHNVIIPQLKSGKLGNLSVRSLTIGSTIFVIGLFKKVIFADSIAPVADLAFDLTGEGALIHSSLAAIGLLAYTMQIYFDFSGYSDMAVGLALLFGLKIPFNFRSPYKAISVSDFWRRWHITLSEFFRDYLYIPLGGSRRGRSRTLINLLVTMSLVGLWHGAGWNFVLWGGLHGLFLLLHRVWQTSSIKEWLQGKLSSDMSRLIAISVTFIAVSLAWVPFRATGFLETVFYYQSLFHFDKTALDIVDAHLFLEMVPFLLFLMLIVFFAPNTQKFLQINSNIIENSIDIIKEDTSRHLRLLVWRPTVLWAVIFGCAFTLTIIGLLKPSPFLYFNF